ncbi:MAG: hypothetical protein LDL41_10935 [Coleofasciculus sp. S288]|nr:hypothetical protein [Coleofasciculus sp. S288]
MLVNTSLIQKLLQRISPKSIEVLLRYPDMRSQVLSAMKLAPKPMGYEPTLIEIFDNSGLLAGRINDFVYTVQLPPEHCSEFIAWYFDGELVLFAVGSEVVVNRLQLMTVTGLFDVRRS